MEQSLLERRHWIFDMDGTLTLAAHDFEAFKRANGMPEDRPILEVLAEWPLERAQAVQARLLAWEEEVAQSSRAAADAVVLLEYLRAGGYRRGVLTRNTRRVAMLTLAAADLGGFFAPEDVLGRDCAAPKPSPAGVERLLAQWGATPTDAVMVGDYIFDIEAGQRAGTATVLVDRAGEGFSWQDQAGTVVARLDALLTGGEPSRWVPRRGPGGAG